ncbi:MAG TPA: hypothetical protein VD860_17220 [Azospirillum sp.]|nr:hypothetical protein [Azospirillum sp.]
MSEGLLFPRAAPSAAAPKKTKKPSLLEKSLGFLMEDVREQPAGQGDLPIDYDKLRHGIREQIVAALFSYLDSKHQLTEAKRHEVEMLLKLPKEWSLAAEPDTRYVGLQTLFDIRLRVPGDAACEPHPSWLGQSAAYGVPSWVVRLSVIEPLLDTLSNEDRQKLLRYLEQCILKGEEPQAKSFPFAQDHPCTAVFIFADKFTQPENIAIVKRAREIPGKASLIGAQLRHLKTPKQIAFVNDVSKETLSAMIHVVRSAQARAEEFCAKNPKDSLPRDAMSSGDSFEDLCAVEPLLMQLFSEDAEDVKERDNWVAFLGDMLNGKGIDTWPTLNNHSNHIDLLRKHADALQVIMDNLEHFSDGKIKLFLESFNSIEMMERFYNQLKQDFPDSLKRILPLPNFDAILRKAADAFKDNRKADYDTVVQTMRTRLEAMLSAEQKHEANARGNVRGTQF